jgi:hypothetical protein
LQLERLKDNEPRIRGSPAAAEHCVGFKILPSDKFHTNESFDYVALSRSPDFTPPESDRLISVIEEYMKQT